jgi:hypothetical protein
MRTTVTIDPDVEALLKKAMRERGQPFKQVLNNAVRDGLRMAQAKPEKPFRQRTFDMGLPLVDLTKANTLAAELEDQELVAKLRAGR